MTVKFVKYINLINRPRSGPYTATTDGWGSIVHGSSSDLDAYARYLEVVATNSGSSGNVWIYRSGNTDMSSASFGTSDDYVTVPGSISTPTRYRSGLGGFNSTYPYNSIYSIPSGVTIYSARIVVVHSDATQIDKTVSHFEIGQYEATRTHAVSSTWYPLTYPKYFYYNSDDWSGTVSAYAYCTIKYLDDKQKATVSVSVYRSSDASFSSSQSVVNIAAGVNPLSTTIFRVSMTLSNNNYYRIETFTTDIKYGDIDFYNGGIEIIQTDLTNGITKTVSPLHLINQYEATTGANNQEYKGRYDPAEWDDSQGATGLTAKTNISSPSGGGSGSIYNASGQLSNSLASGTYHATATTAVTLPVSAGDIWAYVES